jgi:hypothetical protein
MKFDNIPGWPFPKEHPFWLCVMDIPREVARVRAIAAWLNDFADHFESDEALAQFFEEAVRVHYQRSEESARVKTQAEPMLVSGFVYLMRNSRNGLVKIGFSTNPKYREATLQSEEPEVTMIFSALGTRRDERSLHHDYLEFRVRGEWFNLTDGQIAEIKEWMWME